MGDRRTGDFETLLADPGMVGVPVADQRPIPPLLEPDVLPAVGVLSLEPLVAIDLPGIVTLPAYAEAGWPNSHRRLVLRREVVHRLRIALGVLPRGFGIAVLDGWREPSLQQALHDATYGVPGIPPGFVSAPSDDPSKPPPHVSGGAVDLTLSWDGTPLALGTPFDAFVPEARADALEATPGAGRELRRLLYWSMRTAGFVVFRQEWWHYEFGTTRWAAITGGEPRYGATRPLGPAG